MKTSKSTVSVASHFAIEAILKADPGVTPRHRTAILHAIEVPPGDKSEYMTATEAAALLGVSTLTVTRWIDKGRLDGFRIGHRTTAATVASVEAMKKHLADHPLKR